jgi:hypothetical protein
MEDHETFVAPLFHPRLSDLVRREIRRGNRARDSRHRAARDLYTSRVPVLVTCAAALVTLCSTADASEKAPKPLTMTLSAAVSAVRSDVAVRARVEPDARSRELIIEWVAEDLSGGSHSIALEGARAAASHRLMLKYLTPGQYEVTATLRRNDGTHTRSTATLLVVGIGDSVGLGRHAIHGSTGERLRPATAR